MTTLENVCYAPQRVNQLTAHQAREKGRTLLSRVGLQDKTDTYPPRLSGGQKQRLSLARVLLRQPNILLLDEATNSLDAESDFVVQQNLKALKGECTTLVIAHRLSTVVEADRILVLNQGHIEQIGTHAKLMQQDGLYRNFARLEFGAITL